jgi:hypothetical protein
MRTAQHRTAGTAHCEHRHEASVLVFEQIADLPLGQLIEQAFLPSSLVALQVPPSAPGVDTLLLSLAAVFNSAAGAGF